MNTSTQAAVIGEINRFWREAGPGKWFGGGAAFDAECERFREAHFAAARGECEAWLDAPEGALAALILLDQIPRNLFRGSAHSWAADGFARQHAQHAITAGLDMRIEPALRLFFYLPYEHSESLEDQQRSLALFTALGDDGYLDYAQRHLDVIARFGRFPHRNAALGRPSTADEQAWLEAGGGF